MQKLLHNALLAVASFALALGAAELATRLFVGPVPADLRTPWRRHTMRVPETIRAPAAFRGVPYLLKPDAEVVQDFGSNPRGYFDGQGTLTYRTNSQGWRDGEFEGAKPAGVFRILVIGDSFAFGTGVRLEHILSTRLGERLEAEQPGRFQVLNLGVPGYNTAHEVALLHHYGVHLDPDLVVIVFVLNDAVTLTPRSMQPAPPSLPAHAQGPSRSLLFDHLRVRWDIRARREAWARDLQRSYQPEDPGWDRARTGLQLVGILGRKHRFRAALVIFPLLWDLGRDYPFREIHQFVAAAAQEAGIPVLDLLPVFGERDAESLWVHPADHHPNEEAHARAADALHGFVLERGLLGATAGAR